MPIRALRGKSSAAQTSWSSTLLPFIHSFIHTATLIEHLLNSRHFGGNKWILNSECRYHHKPHSKDDEPEVQWLPSLPLLVSGRKGRLWGFDLWHSRQCETGYKLLYRTQWTVKIAWIKEIIKIERLVYVVRRSWILGALDNHRQRKVPDGF